MKNTNSIVALTLTIALGMGPILIVAAAAERPLKPSVLHTKTGPATPRSRRMSPRRVQTPVVVEGQTSTTLPDGRILLVGGLGADGPTTSLAVSNPRTGKTSSLPAMRIARAWHTATMLPDGRVLIFGGIGPNERVLSTALILDPATGRIEELPAQAGLTARAHHTATLLTNGHLLITGGVAGKEKLVGKAQLLDLETQTAEPLETVSIPRQKHQATLLADGNVLIEGGADQSNNQIEGAELFNVETKSFSPTSISSKQDDGQIPYLSASLPQDRASEVPVETRVALRFSKPLPVESIRHGLIKFETADEGVAVKIVPAENGRLAFISPLEPLRKGTTYTVSVNSSPDGSVNLSPSSFSFTTIASQTDWGNRGSADVDWSPGDENLNGNWRTNLERSKWQDQPPLQAGRGETALSGQVLTVKGDPLSNIKISIDGQTTLTDQAGQFLLKLAGGHHVMLIDGRAASRPGSVYGVFRAGVDITAGQTNVLPFTIWMPKLDMAHVVTIPSPTNKDIVVTNPRIPGLELHLPAGTVIRDLDGKPVTQLNITPVPTDRTPFPLPAGINVPVFASIQPGGSSVIPARARLIYPNYNNERPGKRINFWNYDPEGKGWYIYGQGTVTPNGKQIIPDPGVVIYEFNGIMISSGGDPADTFPPCGQPDKGGDPVDLSTGLFVLEKTDFLLPDLMPLVLKRTYRPGDPTSRSFGIGSTHPYEIFLWSDNNYNEADLILADGAKIHYTRISSGTGFTDAIYEHTETPSQFYKSQLYWNNNGGWDLRLKNGTVFVFPDNAPLNSIRDRYGNQITITRSSGLFGNITKLSSPSGRWLEFTYGSGNRISQIKDNSGRTVGYTYDASNRLWKVTDANGEITEYTYDSSHRMLTITDARGILYLTNEYDSNGRVITQTQADTTTYEFDYTLNGSGKVTQTDVTDPRGNVRRLTFNSSGYTLTDTRALGETEEQTITYERQSGTNLVLSFTDPLNHETEYTYDSNGNIASVTRLPGTVDEITTSFTYEPTFSQLATVTDPLSHTTTIAYDNAGNASSVTDPLTHQTTFTYNALGQRLTAANALTNTVAFTYDGGDLVSITNPLSKTVTRHVDSVGRLTRVTDPLGRSTSFAYDNLNQLTSSVNALQGTSSFTYDENGNLLSVSDARSGVTSYEYDDMDRLITRTDPLTHDDTYEYDANGNLEQITDREGQITTFVYDALNRLTEVTYDDSSTITYTYDVASRVTEVDDSVSGTITYEYDDLDRLIEETTPQGTVSYTYDDAGRRTAMTVTGETAVNYTYDNANRLTQITKGTPTVTIAYDNADRRSSLTLPNGVVTEYTFDAASQLTALVYKYGGSTLGSLSYTYDAAGRRTSAGGSYARTGLPQAVNSATYNAGNRQTAFGSLTLTYDLNGNLTGDGTNTYTWNARNQLSSISGGASASFGYDGVGRRTTKTLSSTTTTHLYEGRNVVQELSGSTPTANILTGGLDELFTRAESSATTSFLGDGVGNILGLTNSSGAVQTEYTYEPFGKSSTTGTANANPSQFTARENDGTGLYYYRARYYSPSLQRFISEDPIGYLGGQNLYAYVNNDPFNYRDPLGLDPQDQGGPCQPQNGHPVQPHNSPGEIIPAEVAKIPAEVIHPNSIPTRVANRGLPIAGGLGDLAPPLYYYVEKKNEQTRQINEICCERKICDCPNPDEPGDPNDPNNPNGQPNPNVPYDPNNPDPYGGNYPPGSGNNPLPGRSSKPLP